MVIPINSRMKFAVQKGQLPILCLVTATVSRCHHEPSYIPTAATVNLSTLKRIKVLVIWSYDRLKEGGEERTDK